MALRPGIVASMMTLHTLSLLVALFFTSGDAMTLEQNKATARRWTDELWGRGNLAVADDIIAADYVRHDAGDPFPARGPEDVKKIVTMLRTMLPDLNIEIEAMVAEGDRSEEH